MNAFDEVYEIVRRISPGRVMTYGQVSKLLPTATLSPAAVGWALNQCPDDVPWHRVLNASGRSSVDRDGKTRQRKLLEREGVSFRPDGSIDLKQYRQS